MRTIRINRNVEIGPCDNRITINKFYNKSAVGESRMERIYLSKKEAKKIAAYILKNIKTT